MQLSNEFDAMTQQPADKRSWHRYVAGDRRWLLLPLLVAIILPIVVLLVSVFPPDVALWQRIWRTFLPDVLWNTIRLSLSVGFGTFAIGTFFAWLVSTYDFPARGWFEHLLLLPLAIPGFIMGFVYVTIFEFAGPVQTAFRDWFGWSRGEYWFPNIASPTGLAIVLTLVLYPYVYVLARTAFREQASTTLEAAQVMGYNTWQRFRRVSLPLARPHIAAGVLLVVMEAMTDYGTVSYFGYPTLSERIVVLWNTSFDMSAATQLAALMVVIALILMITERYLRGQARYYQQGGHGRRIGLKPLNGGRRWLATGACSALFFVAFVLPVSQLLFWTWNELQNPTVNLLSESMLTYIRNSLILATSAAIVIVVLALLVAYNNRRDTSDQQNRFHWLTRLITIGYAMPGAVIAAGVLIIVNPIDGAFTNFAAQYLGWSRPGYILTGTILALSYAYVVRFMAVGFNSVEASMDKIRPNMEGAARTMGAGNWRILTRVHFPLVRMGMVAGSILVFVDVMKELPITLLLRPFGLDTLALRTYFLSIEGWHESAAIPALIIVLVGLLPVFFLMRVGQNQRGS
jgi:iron(III) transport system permease protein